MIEETITRLLRQVCPQTFPLVAPQGVTAPFIIYTRVSTPRLRDTDGPVGMAMPTFRVDAYALDFDAALLMARGIRLAMDGYRDIEICDIALINEQDMSDLTSNPALSRVQLEFRITHRE